MSAAASTDETKAGIKKHSPVFLAVFAVFLIATTICAVGTVLGILGARLAHHDTQWYWASGQLLIHHGNPYSEEAVHRMQASAGVPVYGSDVLRYPPTALFLMTPLALLGPRAGVVAWSLLMAAFLALSLLAIQAMLGPAFDRKYLLLAWFFAPTLCCIEMGQTGVILLLGLALFLRFHNSRPLWAGAALSLCAVKPHLFLPFGVVLLAWIATRRRWGILWGALLALAVESAFAMAFDPAVWMHYRTAMLTQVFEYAPTLGVELRLLMDRTAMWLQFVPAAVGCVWGLWYFMRNRERWDWRTHGSILTLVSLVVAPFAWFTDQVLAIPAILFVLLGPRRGSLTLLLAIMSAGAIEMMSTSTLLFWPYLWQGLAWLAWYVYAASGTAPVDDALAVG
ncbi:MAG: glycosyltransferase family 87 protein [Silvibacterium sp.]